MADRDANLKIEPCKLDDAADLASCFHSAFIDVEHPQAPFYRAMFPRTPPVRDFFTKSFKQQLKDDKSDSMLKVVDASKGNSLVGFIKWTPPGAPESYWADFAEDSDERLCDAFFTAMAESRAALMQDRPHYFLEIMGVHHKYARKGIGSRLIEVGCKKADEAGLECYVDASPLAKPLYEKHGFVCRRELPMPAPFNSYTECFLVRPATGSPSNA